MRHRSSLFRNQKTTGQKMRTLNIRHWSNYQKVQKKGFVDFHSATRVYPLHPQMGAERGRSQMLIHFHFLDKKISSPSRLTSTPPDFLLSGYTSPHPPCWLAGWSRSGGPPPYEKSKLSLSNQLGPLVHALGVDLVPAVETGQLTVIDYPVLLF